MDYYQQSLAIVLVHVIVVAFVVSVDILAVVYASVIDRFV